ncbi:MAG TPA: hypothetical protein VJ840_12765 [Gemmatimonadaceae bacterium]|nr:hypothetical protein [Gemmatimonadaceae bacterium]
MPRAALASILQLFLICFALTGLAAYSFAGVPLPWVGFSGFAVLAAGLILSTNRIRLVPGNGVLFLFVAWTLFAQVLNAGRFGVLMPRSATLSYTLYVAVRYLDVLSFAGALYVCYWLLTEGAGEELVRWIVRIGAIVAALAIYIYIAQQYGLWEPARTRIGTAGAAQVLFFGYRRALGTFREPSHLAEWLVLPFFLSFVLKDRASRISGLVIGLALLLTVSLGGIGSAVAGMIGGLILNNPLRPKNLKRIAVVGIALGVLIVAAKSTSIGLGGQSVYTMLNVRTLDILEGGIGNSNRAYIADFVSNFPPPVIGYGLGNANIFAASKMGIDLIVSFLSLYVNVMYSSGIVGFGLLALFLAQPIFRRALYAAGSSGDRSIAVLMGYVAYLFLFAAGAEELSISFAIITAFMLYDASTGHRATEGEKVAPQTAASSS